MSFDDLKAEIENRDSLSEDNASDQWREGDVCGENGCERDVHTLKHPRDPETTVPAHPDANEIEFVCIDHGIVASR